VPILHTTVTATLADPSAGMGITVANEMPRDYTIRIKEWAESGSDHGPAR
jgi:hypothetical protein